MITLGTGVGGGIVFDGKLIDGNHSQGAQLGHGVIVHNGRRCGCGRRGCLEAYASASALSKQTAIAVKKNPNSQLAKCAQAIGKVNAKVAFDAAKLGDPLMAKDSEELQQYNANYPKACILI